MSAGPDDGPDDGPDNGPEAEPDVQADIQPDIESPADKTAGPSTGSETGSVSLFVVVAVIALMLAIGLVVDGGHKVLALQRANATAEEAARAASQQILAAPSVRGQAPQLDVRAAQRAGEAYIAAANAAAGVNATDLAAGPDAATDPAGLASSTGDTTVQGSVTAQGTRVEVTVTVTEPTVFLAAIGIPTVSATSHATARLVRGLDQEVP